MIWTLLYVTINWTCCSIWQCMFIILCIIQQHRLCCRHLTSGYGSNRTTPVGSRNQSREASRNRDSSRNRDAPAAPDGDVEKRATAAAATPAATEHSTEYIEKKSKSLIDEYLQIHDMKVNLCCCCTRSHWWIANFVTYKLYICQL